MEFDVDAFLDQRLNVYIALNGPSLRPAWFLWEDKAFWMVTGVWATWHKRLMKDPKVALVVDRIDLDTGTVLQVNARGKAEVLPNDPARSRRIIGKYRGADESKWDDQYRMMVDHEETVNVRIVPEVLKTIDMSYPVVR